MNVGNLRRGRLARVMAIATVATLVAAGGLWWWHRSQEGTRITAYFGAAVGVYPGSDVRVLGMQVGSIDDVLPQGPVVRVDMTVQHGITIPAGARAVAVAPSLVSDRYVQLTPAYSGGPTMADGAVIPRQHTATPVELDELTKDLNKVTTALGPNGANRNGALSDALNTGAANLAGNGQDLNQTITQLGQAANALSDSRGDLFTTVDNLQKFTAMLAGSDQQIHQLDGQLADVSGLLASERGELAQTLAELPPALEQVRGFIDDNRGEIKSNVDHLTKVTQTLVDQRNAVAEVLDVAPLAAGNLVNAYDSATGTVRTRANINELTNPPIVLVCKLLAQSPPKQMPQFLSDACGKLAPVLSGALPLPSPADTINSLQQGKPPQLPLPLVNVLPGGGPQGGGR